MLKADIHGGGGSVRYSAIANLMICQLVCQLLFSGQPPYEDLNSLGYCGKLSGPLSYKEYFL